MIDKFSASKRNVILSNALAENKSNQPFCVNGRDIRFVTIHSPDTAGFEGMKMNCSAI